MLKAILLAVTSALVFASVTTRVSVARAESQDDVFLDEGDGDFGAIPIPDAQPVETPSADASTVGSDPLLAEPTEATESTEPAASESAPAPESKPAPKKAKVAKAKKSSHKVAQHKSSGHGLFMTTKDSCPMMREPASTGDQMITVKASKKIWVEEVDDSWVRGFNKAGEPGYLSRDCF